MTWERDKPKEVIRDPRGDIVFIAEGEFRTILLIESKKGTVRANHWHKTDSHTIYILYGQTNYHEENHGVLEVRQLGPGDSVTTGPGVPHAMEFLEDTMMIVGTKNARDYEAYMGDIVKCELI